METKQLVPFEAISEVIKKAYQFQVDGHGEVMVDMSGHVTSLTIRLFINKWVAYANPDFSRSVYLKYEDNPDVVEELAEVGRELDEFIYFLPAVSDQKIESQRQAKLAQYEQLKQELGL